jgi:hypothetical protein
MDWRRQLKEYAYFCKLITQMSVTPESVFN